MQILKNFATKAGVELSWEMSHLKDEFIRNIKETVGEDHVIGAVSGGVDSSVAALLMKEAIGDQFHAVMVDNGLLRL
eukprot:CAMPEP_0116893564 /NCGR_PEP_ID=MMETSP0467-20121206/3520_1 /TAXON_ID=283647 /ORGANISM="Mesodinium pulex, Strain SPMC105" /LENGTH=76 /DNA_ID=CAMNT_0004563285 /DNA_START=503 /DNA_END=733 /DNA_ORIENTATION=+